MQNNPKNFVVSSHCTACVPVFTIAMDVAIFENVIWGKGGVEDFFLKNSILRAGLIAQR